MTSTCMPYEYNWSQDVEKCTLDLVLSSYTHTNAVQAIAVASKGCWFFLLHPLRLVSKATDVSYYTVTIRTNQRQSGATQTFIL